MIMRTKLPISMWGHAILHAASLIRMRPSAYHKYSPIQLASGQEPNISHLRIFGYAVYVPIAPPQRTKIGSQRRLGIYVGYETSSIIRYVESLTSDVFTTRFTDCHFNEAISLRLVEKRKPMRKMSRGVNLPCCILILALNKDKNPRKRKGTEKNSDHDENVLNEIQDIKTSYEEEMNDMNKEMSISYSQQNILWDRNEIGDIDVIFSYSVASDIMSGDDDPEPKSVIDCQNRPDWDKWKDAMQAELNTLNKRKKRNEKNEVTSLAVSRNLEMHHMDVVTAYLYGSIDNDLYMKIPEGFKIPESLSSKPKEIYSIKLQRSLYGLKQSGRMWYNHLSYYLISKGYKSNLICPCVFIKKTTSGFVIIVVDVDDLNIIGTNKEINEVVMHLKKEFKMKDLGKTKYCLGLQIEYIPNGILVHQSNYTETVLKRFNMDKAKSLSTPMVGRSLNVNNDPFRPYEEYEDVLGPEVPYLSAIGALMYPTNCTRPDISFSVNLLARFRLVGYADAGYLSDPHKARSQTDYIFINGGTSISWRSQKQTLVATSSNHAEVIALHEASREYVWLRSMTQLIVTSCGLNIEKSPTIIHEDNAACVT
uniref:Retrovirus-related Pol polyprotein from transposon TNT 1-94 n=1 Tax=Tanacetum cinerariifolium TaxID=118510 RepID=A0A699HD48_TANCI|nr:retrovirus-related Pol polyprotein from transposon TNT 1-94 [Tanacetum cinerariifolium]